MPHLVREIGKRKRGKRAETALRRRTNRRFLEQQRKRRKQERLTEV